VADVMNAAGLTQGGSYRHFATKDAMVEAAMEAAFAQSVKPLEARIQKDGVDAAVDSYRDHYRSEVHVRQPGIGCPVVALGAGVARGAIEIKRVFSEGVGRVIALFARRMRGAGEARRARAAREFAMLLGAVVIARASDTETAMELLNACRTRPGR
jgi:TetR/AcrR family transcriptional repressor of nem operon